MMETCGDKNDEAAKAFRALMVPAPIANPLNLYKSVCKNTGRVKHPNSAVANNMNKTLPPADDSCRKVMVSIPIANPFSAVKSNCKITGRVKYSFTALGRNVNNALPPATDSFRRESVTGKVFAGVEVEDVATEKSISIPCSFMNHSMPHLQRNTKEMEHIIKSQENNSKYEKISSAEEETDSDEKETESDEEDSESEGRTASPVYRYTCRVIFGPGDELMRRSVPSSSSASNTDLESEKDKTSELVSSRSSWSASFAAIHKRLNDLEENASDYEKQYCTRKKRSRRN